MGNKGAKPIPTPDYTKDDNWACGDSPLDYAFPKNGNKHITEFLNEEAVANDTEYDAKATKEIIDKVMTNFDPRMTQRNPFYVFYAHYRSPTVIGDEENKLDDQIQFEIGAHASIFKFEQKYRIYSPKFRNDNGELQAQDIQSAFEIFTSMIKEKLEDQMTICPFIVVGQGFNSRILYDELLKLDKALHALLILALLPGYALPAKAPWFNAQFLHWRTFEIGNTDRFQLDYGNNNEQKIDDNYTNPVLFSQELRKITCDENPGALVIVNGSHSAHFRYLIAGCQIVKSKRGKGIQLSANGNEDKRLEESFSEVRSELLFYWIAIRKHVKTIVIKYYQTALQPLVQNLKKAKQAEAEIDDL